jgi:hypothetical protein
MDQLVAAAGIEPCCSDNLNLLMASEFDVYRFRNLQLLCRFESPRVPSSPLESPPVFEIYWRLPSLISPAKRRETDTTHITRGTVRSHPRWGSGPFSTCRDRQLLIVWLTVEISTVL